LPCLQQITPDDGHRKCPKHVEFYDKINFGYLMHLVGVVLYENSIGLHNYTLRNKWAYITSKRNDFGPSLSVKKHKHVVSQNMFVDGTKTASRKLIQNYKQGCPLRILLDCNNGAGTGHEPQL
jgi:hypothetical protein